MAERVTDEMVMDARRAAWAAGIQDPYVARIADHPDLDDLRAADAEAERQNMEAWRAVLTAALTAEPT